MPRVSRVLLPAIVLLAASAAVLVLLSLSQAFSPPTVPSPTKPVPATSLAAVLPDQGSATVVVLDAPTATPLPEGRTAPVFSLPGLDDKLHRLTDYRGKQVALNFWATWCVPCRLEMPLLEKTYQRLQGSGVVVIGINMGEAVSPVRQYVEDLHITFPILLDADQTAAAQYQVIGLPTTFFIDGQGIVRASQVGPLDEDSLQSYLDRLSKANSGGSS